jgi:hypothetical protein
MSTAASVIPAPVDSSNGTRRGQSYSSPSRTQSTRTRSTAAAAAPSPARASSSYSRPPSGAHIEEILPHRDYETTNVARTSSRRSSDRPAATRTEPTRSGAGHQRNSSRSDPQYQHQTSVMTGTTAVANGGGPAPVVTPIESRHSGRSSARSRTTIPAQTGNWVLGKTIGAGSMGKVKLARRAEGGEQVCVYVQNHCCPLDEPS